MYVGVWVWVCHWMELHKCVCVYVGVWVCHWMELHKCVMEAAELLVVWVYICTYVCMYITPSLHVVHVYFSWDGGDRSSVCHFVLDE